MPSDAVAFIDSQHPTTGLTMPSLRVQYDEIEESVACLITYSGKLGSISAATRQEMILLTWSSDTDLLFQFVADRATLNSDSKRVIDSQLDGDLVCSIFEDRTLSLWDWKRNCETIFDTPVQHFVLKAPYIFYRWGGSQDIVVLRSVYQENESRPLAVVTVVANIPFEDTIVHLKPLDSDAWIRREPDDGGPISLLGSTYRASRYLQWEIGSTSFVQPILTWSIMPGCTKRTPRGIVLTHASIWTRPSKPLLLNIRLYPWTEVDDDLRAREFTTAQPLSPALQGTASVPIRTCIDSGTFLIEESWGTSTPQIMWYQNYRWL
ncbi:hypothetical protein DL93DRAFT_2087850 [Clavulina sp. PMI_390]|nr:hypothetical protein DL93DRAFT_2087850 [Clavulina sp. PMI_390]